MSIKDRIADDLRMAIERGELQPGATLPSEPQLAKAYGVSSGTARAALVKITSEGLVIASQGRQRTVRTFRPLEWPWTKFERRDDHLTGYDGIDAWEQQVRDLGREPSVEVVVEIVSPPQNVLRALQLEADDIAVVRRRVRYVDGSPYLLQDSWFDEKLVRGTPLMRPGDVSAPGGVLASIGHTQSRYLDRIGIRMPTSTETERLALQPGTPVAEHTRIGYDTEGVPLRCMLSILPGDRHTLVYEVGAE